MKKHIIQFFKFLEDKEGKLIPLEFKFLYPEIFGKYTKEQLKVKGDLNLSRTNIKELPQGLEVDGELNLSGTSIKELPEGLKVGENLWLSSCRSLTKLPEGLKVGESLILSGCRSLTKLPEGLKVGENLFLVNTLISEKSSKEQIRSTIEDRGGYVNGLIII